MRQVGPATELLQALVRAASPNPPGDERAVMAVARTYLADIPGMVIQDVGVAPERPMLVASLEGHRAGRTLTFAGHVDTVPAGAGWTHDPFGAELSDSRLYGRGASDMKGGVAGFLVALRQLAHMRERWAGSLIAHIVPDEEPGGQNGTAILLARGLIGGDAAVVAEPSELCAFRAQKGNLFAQLCFSGRSAHGSTPELGQNAILMAARTAIQLEDVLAPVLARRRHELVGCATVSVGTIAGGQRTNMVSDECVLTIDRRLIPGEDPEEAAAELELLVGGAATITYEHIGAAFETSADHWLVRAATDIINTVRGETCPIGGLVGSSDARYYAAGAGVPTIIIGPGAMSEAHAPDESVDLRLLELSVEVYRELALRVLAPGVS